MSESKLVNDVSDELGGEDEQEIIAKLELELEYQEFARNIFIVPAKDGIISPLGSYNIYGNAIRCFNCNSLYHVIKDCEKKI
jgi:hypothetical protein